IAFLDEPDLGDLYNFCPAEEGEPRRPERIDVEADRVLARFDGVEVAFRVSRRAGEPFIRLGGVIRNERRDHRVRLHVSLPSPVDRMIAGAPFELVERPLVSEGSLLATPSRPW